MMGWISTLALAICFLGTASAGSVFIWLPFMSKSVKITVMPVAEAMADRGHEVVIVLPHPTPEGFSVSKSCGPFCAYAKLKSLKSSRV